MNARTSAQCVAWAQLLAAVGIGIVQPAAADTSVDSDLRSRMVLQRDASILVYGQDDPHTDLVLSVGTTKLRTRSDSDGGWRIEVPPQEAGGPHKLKIEGSSEVVFEDILFGDVWLCSGQSNMEWTIDQLGQSPRADQDGSWHELRLLTIPRTISLAPRRHLTPDETWHRATSDEVAKFSAACFYFGQYLRSMLGVPIGLISSSWGGTNIEPWIPSSTLTSAPGLSKRVTELLRYQEDPKAARESMRLSEEQWWKEFDSGAANEELWRPVEPSPFDALGLDEFDGSAWYRAEFLIEHTIPKSALTLRLGCIDDRDTTWVNGIEVGRTNNWSSERHYRIDANIIKEGKNKVLIRVLDTGGRGGLVDCQASRYVSEYSEQGRRTPLSGWEFAPGQPISSASDVPKIPYEENRKAVSVLYNGMIAPLARLPMRGVAWYQGESNTQDSSAYETLLRMLMSSWREGLGKDLPFLIVQLSAYEDPNLGDWATLRGAQASVVENDTNSRLVVTIDIGERDDIHPKNKRDVGLRLAYAAGTLFESNSPMLSPVVDRTTSTENGVLITFSNVGRQLVSVGNAAGIKLQYCLSHGTGCETVTAAVANSDSLVVSNLPGYPGKLRYAWENFPDVTLFNSHGLPVSPFSLSLGGTEKTYEEKWNELNAEENR